MPSNTGGVSSLISLSMLPSVVEITWSMASLLPSNAVLVNVGRAEVVDEKALYEALKKGAIKAAGLDVWYQYPSKTDPSSRSHTMPSTYPFHELDNVVFCVYHCAS